MFPSARYVVVGNMDRQDEGGPMLGLREMGWGELMETPRSPGAVIKMASRCGDEKACLALWAYWRCSPAYLEHPLFMSFYKFQLTFLSVVNVCFWFGHAGCVCPPTRWKNWSYMTAWHYKLKHITVGCRFLITFKWMLCIFDISWCKGCI